MANQVTRKDLDDIATTIIEAVDERFGKLDSRMDSFEGKLNELTETLDNFLK